MLTPEQAKARWRGVVAPLVTPFAADGALDLGADAVQISGPFYYDGRPADVVAWMEEVARHTGIGFAIYNNWYTGYDMPLELSRLPSRDSAVTPELREVFKKLLAEVGDAGRRL